MTVSDFDLRKPSSADSASAGRGTRRLLPGIVRAEAARLPGRRRPSCWKGLLQRIISLSLCGGITSTSARLRRLRRAFRHGPGAARRRATRPACAFYGRSLGRRCAVLFFPRITTFPASAALSTGCARASAGRWRGLRLPSAERLALLSPDELAHRPVRIPPPITS